MTEMNWCEQEVGTGGVSGVDTGFLKGGGTVYERLPEAVHRGT